jgi:hypothetical protein
LIDSGNRNTQQEVFELPFTANLAFLVMAFKLLGVRVYVIDKKGLATALFVDDDS